MHARFLAIGAVAAITSLAACGGEPEPEVGEGVAETAAPAAPQ